jgi:plasmid stabilization system protein ParE
MATIRYSDTALEDRFKALRTIEDYFASKQSGLAEKHTSFFNRALEHQEDLLEEFPKLYPEREDFFYGSYGIRVRSFEIHWFTVFYTYDEDADEIVFWFIRSSRSDLSRLYF